MWRPTGVPWRMAAVAERGPETYIVDTERLKGPPCLSDHPGISGCEVISLASGWGREVLQQRGGADLRPEEASICYWKGLLE